MGHAPTSLGIVALPYEITTSFLQGTANAPDTILNELAYLDTFDFSLGRDPLKNIPRQVIRPHDKTLVDPGIQQSISNTVVSEILNSGGFPICLGGEHTVSIGPVKATKSVFGNIGVVQLDAHSDLRDSYEGSAYSHACVMRRINEMGCGSLGAGIRSMSEGEAKFIAANDISIVSAKEVCKSNEWYSLLEDLPDKIYLTIDMDVFDPGEVPAVGTPEPGGISWYHVRNFLSYLFTAKNVVAADIVELMPRKGDAASVRLATRLLALLIGLRFSHNV